MRKLILEEWMSLDGYIADKNDGLDFFTHLTPEQNTYSDKDQLRFLESIDNILLGRKTYELFVDFWPDATTDKEAIADKLNEIPKLIVSNTMTRAPWGKWPDAGIINGNIINAIERLKAQPGKNIVLWGSISLAQTLMRENLIDEYHIQLCPVRLGGGRKLFPEGLDNADLELVEVRKYDTGTIFLNYRLK
ncbi:MAG TPA: dihydrofolate reductase family protein [Puia sp.]|jgi:dihydrofolate reductase